MDFPTPDKNILSKEYWVIPSQQRFGASKSILVFSGTIRIKDILGRSDIKLVSDFNRRKTWELHKIIQRNITSSRVDAIKENYLKNKRKAVKFFPAVTVALLPLSEGAPGDVYKGANGFLGSTGINLTDPSGEHFKDPFKDDSEYWNFPARLSWNLNDIVAVVIDGQHRIEALRRFANDDNGEFVETESLPISFLLFTPETSPIEATRQVFIDVNNTPRRVSEQKLIFIDDNHLPRKLTATLLGAKLEVDADDPYVSISTRGHLVRSDFDERLNRYLVGEEESDDASLNLGFTRTHEDLLPWELTHIMTLHEVILQRILLPIGSAYSFAGNPPNMKRIAQIINHAATYNILHVDEGSMQDLVSLKDEISNNPKLNKAEVRVFKKLISWIEDYNEEYKQAKLNGEDEDFADEIKERYESLTTSASALEQTVDDNNELIRGNLSRVITLIKRVFSELWFTDELVKLLTSDDYLSAELKLQVIEESRAAERKKKRKLTSLHDYDGFSEYLGTRLELDDGEIGAVRQWLSAVQRITSGNLLRSQVGQQALFVWLRRSDSVQENDLTGVLLDLDDQLGFVNRLGIAGFFEDTQVFPFEIGRFEVKGNCFEGTIIEGGKMRPGWGNAEKAATVLNILYRGLRSRSDVDNDPTLGLNEYKKTLGAIGGALIRQCENNASVREALYELVEENLDEKFLVAQDIEKFKDVDPGLILEDAKVFRVVKLLIGGLFVEMLMERVSEILP